MTKLLIATNNPGKQAEFKEILAALPLTLTSPAEEGLQLDPEETGVTFAENAILKARAYAQQTVLWALADDSGFEVAGLDGAPGIISARYAGAGISDSDRIAFLLQRLERVNRNQRSARFVCVAALADPTGSIAGVTHGICEGLIIDQPRGGGGFGYDPIFIPQGFDKTFAELPADIKNVISHRARALLSMHAFLERLVHNEQAQRTRLVG